LVWATHVPDRQDSELAESVRFSERCEEALSELPEALGSLSEKHPALPVVIAARPNQLRAHFTFVLLSDFGKLFAKGWS
jgi:hypothetical protein